MSNFSGKTVKESAINDYVHRIFPNDLNSHGTLFGGVMMATCDRIASVIAERHCGSHCVTASCDSMHFLRPAGRGDILVFKGAVNRAWNSSMEIGLKIYTANYQKHTESHILSAYFTFVALDENNNPKAVPPVIPETEDEIRRYQKADTRKKMRKEAALILKNSESSK